MVEVCDDYMSSIPDETIGNIYDLLEARGVDIEESPVIDRTNEQAEYPRFSLLKK